MASTSNGSEPAEKKQKTVKKEKDSIVVSKL